MVARMIDRPDHSVAVPSPAQVAQAWARIRADGDGGAAWMAELVREKTRVGGGVVVRLDDRRQR